MKKNDDRAFSWEWLAMLVMAVVIYACASRGYPEGGPKDTTPPQVILEEPASFTKNFDKKRVNIYFDEFVQLKDINEKFIISPPQKKKPKPRLKGKYVQVEFVDSLKPNTTYTLDFADAISDNNEGNPLGFYRYVFSTGNEIDSLELSGQVVNAESGARDGVGDPMYLYPCGDGDKKAAVNELIRYAENHDGARLTMYCLTPSNVRELEDMMPGKFEFTEMREFADYIYNTTDLIDLAGRKYHGKRNHIAYFKNNHDWHFEPINDGNMQLCLDMNKKWEALNREKDPDEIDSELEAIKRAFSNFDELGFKGGVLYADGEVVAYTLGEELNSSAFCTHIEKAYASVRGAYPTVNREFAANMLANYKFINREDDTGSEGLRKAKLSYYPEILLQKYRAFYKG